MIVLIYVIGVLVTAAILAYLDEPVKHSDHMWIGGVALMWPIVLPVVVMAGIVWVIGWFGRKVVGQ